MMKIEFTWDDGKNRSNRKKHGVSFEEAQTVFYDDYARLIYDPDHSKSEDRFVLLGTSARLRVLVICYSYRQKGAVIRIISARKAARNERRQYEEHLP